MSESVHRTSRIEEADFEKRLEYLSIELSFTLHKLGVVTNEKERLWNALDQLLNTSVVITNPNEIDGCFVDLQTCKPHYDEAYKALDATKRKSSNAAHERPANNPKD